jgi:hypothetical protein
VKKLVNKTEKRFKKPRKKITLKITGKRPWRNREKIVNRPREDHKMIE